jgi:hypothetical protein
LIGWPRGGKEPGFYITMAESPDEAEPGRIHAAIGVLLGKVCYAEGERRPVGAGPTSDWLGGE